jgi:hypothetical protein
LFLSRGRFYVRVDQLTILQSDKGSGRYMQLQLDVIGCVVVMSAQQIKQPCR